MRTLLLLFIVLIASPAFAGDASPAIPALSKTAAGFVPGGWTLEQNKEGDLNKDGQADLVLVLRQNHTLKPEKSGEFDPTNFDPINRILVVAFGVKDGGYQLVVRNNSLIPPIPSRGVIEDPLPKEDKDCVKIDGGTFKIKLELFSGMGGWDMGSRQFQFRYQDDSFVLIGFESMTVTRNTGETNDISANYLTRKAKITTGNIEDDHKKKVTWKKLPKATLIRLEDFKDGLLFGLPG